MTRMRVCPKHECAYPLDGLCKWCEPEADSSALARCPSEYSAAAAKLDAAWIAAMDSPIH
jgi:hypothetical protein